jgi:type IV secretory pathway VirB2 component (pilin)
MLSVVGARARQSEDPRSIGEFAQMLSYVGPRVLMPSVLAVIVTGVWMVLASPGWRFTQLWVILALGAFVVAFLVGAIYLSRMALELERLATRTDASLQATRDVLGRWIAGYRVVLLILLFALWDMVFKPVL